VGGVAALVLGVTAIIVDFTPSDGAVVAWLLGGAGGAGMIAMCLGAFSLRFENRKRLFPVLALCIGGIVNLWLVILEYGLGVPVDWWG
jgi:hypothetical protein